jgi:hypothetical protein
MIVAARPRIRSLNRFGGRSSRPQTRSGLRVARCSALAACCALLLAAILPGCSGGGGGAADAGTEPAKATVTAFLDAIKRGDEQSAKSMLTKLARAKTEEMGISVAPPVSSSATYSIKDCERIKDAEDLVHVATTWTDTDGDGFTSTENVIWAVRLEPEGWRVVGMATLVFDDMPPLLLNFEDPEDMIAKQDMVAAELQRRAQQAAAAETGTRTATGPTDGQRK